MDHKRNLVHWQDNKLIEGLTCCTEWRRYQFSSDDFPKHINYEPMREVYGTRVTWCKLLKTWKHYTELTVACCYHTSYLQYQYRRRRLKWVHMQVPKLRIYWQILPQRTQWNPVSTAELYRRHENYYT